MLRYLVNFFYPPRCAGCDRRLSISAGWRLCDGCRAKVERLPEPLCAVCGVPLETVSDSGWCGRCAESPPHFSRARAVARYRAGSGEEEQMLPSLIRRHKYGLDQSLGRALAECLDPLPFEAGEHDLIMPVPLHLARLRWRGFNQAALLGSAIAPRLGRPLNTDTLVRVRETAPQTGQHMGERRSNIHNAFAVRRPAAVANRSVLLIDDVITTGATADECARTLLAAGARRVEILALARAL
jgi:ComF family protein